MFYSYQITDKQSSVGAYLRYKFNIDFVTTSSYKRTITSKLLDTCKYIQGYKYRSENHDISDIL